MNYGLGRPGLLNAGDGTTINDPGGIITVVGNFPSGSTGAIEIPTDPATADYTKYILIGVAVVVALVLVRR